MLKSLFILMLVALMAAVGFYYEKQAGFETGTDSTLVAATVVNVVPEPERVSDVDRESIDRAENNTEPRHANETDNSEADEATIQLFQH